MLLESKIALCDQVLEKYARAEKLSILFAPLKENQSSPERMCFYSHDINGIGCGFSCLLSHTNAQLLEFNFSAQRIDVILDDPLGREIVGRDLDLSSFDDYDFFHQLQQMHDTSDSVKVFQYRLQVFRNNLEYQLKVHEHHGEFADYLLTARHNGLI